LYVLGLGLHVDEDGGDQERCGPVRVKGVVDPEGLPFEIESDRDLVPGGGRVLVLEHCGVVGKVGAQDGGDDGMDTVPEVDALKGLLAGGSHGSRHGGGVYRSVWQLLTKLWYVKHMLSISSWLCSVVGTNGLGSVMVILLVS
jgi:hypothetical protein